MLLIPYERGMDLEEYSTMVSEVNATEVNLEEDENKNKYGAGNSNASTVIIPLDSLSENGYNGKVTVRLVAGGEYSHAGQRENSCQQNGKKLLHDVSPFAESEIALTQRPE